jgi:L-threonylcarbamoyladenylate synthase
MLIIIDLLNMEQQKTFVLPFSEENVKLAGQALKEGKLVSFPTETVYGLGANALNEQACLSIFETKGRPLTDPLIVHVPDMDAALPLICQEDQNVL